MLQASTMGRDDCALWVADILKDALGYDAARPAAQQGYELDGRGGICRPLVLACAEAHADSLMGGFGGSDA